MSVRGTGLRFVYASYPFDLSLLVARSVASPIQFNHSLHNAKFGLECDNWANGDNTLSMQHSGKAQHKDLQELLLEEGEEFVHAAFMVLLNRRPDATGGRVYLRALRNGTSKLQILYELSNSAECRSAGGDIEGLADEFLRAGIGATSGKPVIMPPATALQITNSEQVTMLENIDEFVDVAYWALLKRAPDAEGIANCHDRSRAGLSKLQILNEIFNSPECREIGVELPGLRDAFIREGLEIAPIGASMSQGTPMPAKGSRQAATTLAELLGYQGGEFVECAYLTLLKRMPDRDGYQHRLEQLLDGTSKMQILVEMSMSVEAIKAGAVLPGLATALSRYRLSQIPLLGRFARLFHYVEGNSAAERRGRVAEQRLLTLETEIGERIGKLMISNDSITADKENALVARQNDRDRIASQERSVVVLRQLLVRGVYQPHVAGQLSAVMVSPNSIDRLELALRTEEIARDLKQVQLHQ